MDHEHVMAAPGMTDLSLLVSNAELVLENRFLYRESQELENFKSLVATMRQKQEGWAETLKSHCAEDGEDTGAGDSHPWESVEDATKKVEEEVARVSKRRWTTAFTMLVCCSKAGFHLLDFPPDLTNSFQQLVDNLEPHQGLLKLVESLHKATRQRAQPNDLEELLRDIGAELAKRQVIGSGGKKKISIMHRAAYGGLESLMLALMKVSGKASNINPQDSDGQTPLHYATIAGQTNAARVLLSQPKLRANEEDCFNQTALQIATEMKKKDIEKLLLARSDVQQYVDRLSADRQVYLDAANAVLVGAALIASVSFGGWLQPPLGFTTYYNYPYPYPAPPGNFEAFAAVDTSLSLRVFWILNSLSFFSSVATVIAGAGCALPMPDAFIKHQVQAVRKSLVVTSTLLVISIIFVLGAFAAAGFASLPPSTKYTSNLTGTVIVGSTLCVSLLIWFVRRLYRIRPTWWKQMEEHMFFTHFGNRDTGNRNVYFLS